MVKIPYAIFKVNLEGKKIIRILLNIDLAEKQMYN